MRYEITILVEVHEEADYAGTNDEIENVYDLLESAICDLDDLKLISLEVLEA